MAARRIPVQPYSRVRYPFHPNGGNGTAHSYPAPGPQFYYVQPPQYHYPAYPKPYPSSPRPPKEPNGNRDTKKFIKKLREECDEAEELLELTGRKNPVQEHFLSTEAGGQVIGMIGSIANNFLDKWDPDKPKKEKLSSESQDQRVKAVSDYLDKAPPELILKTVAMKLRERGYEIPENALQPNPAPGPDNSDKLRELELEITNLKMEIEGVKQAPRAVPEPSTPHPVEVSDVDAGCLDDTIPGLMKTLKTISDPANIKALLAIEASGRCRDSVMTALLDRQRQLEG